MAFAPLQLGAAAHEAQWGGVYFLSAYGGTGSDLGSGTIVVDSSNDVYVTGYTNSVGAGGTDTILVKFNSTGAIQWERTLGGASTDSPGGMALDSFDNIYTMSSTSSSGAGSQDGLLVKWDPTGVIEWQRTIGGTGYDSGVGISIDSSDHIYVCGQVSSSAGTPTAGSTDAYLAKYNTSGGLHWQRRIGDTGFDQGLELATDSNNNVYMTGRLNTGSGGGVGNYDILLAKWNSSGTLQWQRLLGGSNSDIGYDIAVDSTDYIYLTYTTQSAGLGGNELGLAKFDSSGAIVWQRNLGGSGADYGTGIRLDSNDNVFVIGRTTSQTKGGEDTLIAKYNSSGVIQWQRLFGSANGEVGSSIAFDSSNNIYTLGYGTGYGASFSNQLTLNKFPNDGSLTGRYIVAGTTNFYYYVSTLYAGTSYLTVVSSTLTEAAGALTSSTSSLSSFTVSQAQQFKGIG